VKVTVVPFARLRELLGYARSPLELPEAASIDDAWDALALAVPSIVQLRDSTRVACNGVLAERGCALRDGDELSLLPPVGGG
jgi:molybdopterin converting factor small subunit